MHRGQKTTRHGTQTLPLHCSMIVIPMYSSSRPHCVQLIMVIAVPFLLSVAPDLSRPVALTHIRKAPRHTRIKKTNATPLPVLHSHYMKRQSRLKITTPMDFVLLIVIVRVLARNGLIQSMAPKRCVACVEPD